MAEDQLHSWWVLSKMYLLLYYFIMLRLESRALSCQARSRPLDKLPPSFYPNKNNAAILLIVNIRTSFVPVTNNHFPWSLQLGEQVLKQLPCDFKQLVTQLVLLISSLISLSEYSCVSIDTVFSQGCNILI